MAVDTKITFQEHLNRSVTLLPSSTYTIGQLYTCSESLNNFRAFAGDIVWQPTDFTHKIWESDDWWRIDLQAMVTDSNNNIVIRTAKWFISVSSGYTQVKLVSVIQSVLLADSVGYRTTQTSGTCQGMALYGIT